MYPLKLLSSNREPMIKLTKPFCYITTETRRLGFKVFWSVSDYASNWIPLWSYLMQCLLPYPEDKEGQWNTACAGAIQPKNDLGGNFWPSWPTLPLLSLLAAPSCPSSSLIYQDTQCQHPGTNIPGTNTPGTNMPGTNILSWRQVTCGSTADIEILISLHPPPHTHSTSMHAIPHTHKYCTK